MNNTLAHRFSAVFILMFVSGCKSPKYANYESIHKDYTVSVPWGWQVMTDSQDDAFTQATFIGPFDPDFYLGAPSLSVRWFKRYRPHRLSDGRLEMYSGAGDFISQMLKQVYGPSYFFVGADGKPVDAVSEITLKSSGLKAKYFTVLSATPVSVNMQWGVSEQKGTDKPHILRKHAYVIVTVGDGFYVLCYPATDAGYDRYLDRFRGLIGSFLPRTAGPLLR